MKLTKEWLQEKSACSEGMKWFLSHKLKTVEGVTKKLIEEDRLDWANWLLSRAMSHPQQIQYAIFSAEQVINIYEKQYPKDDRPRKAIEAAKAYLNKPTEENKAAAYAADAAAHVAAYAADAAAYAAADAAAHAAHAAHATAYAADAAADAAHAAYAAADAAAHAAADAAAYAANAAAYAAHAANAAMKIKIIRYGLKVIAKAGRGK